MCRNTPCFIRRLSAALIIAAGLSTVAAPAAWAQSFQIGPANPAFEAWRDGRMPQAKSGDHALGYIPVPWKQMQFKEEPGAKGPKVFPESYDLRTEGEVTPVKNQGGCGSCWSFATYGSAESWLLKNPAETWDFSENHLKNYHGFDKGPCGGGNDYMSCAYLARGDGPVLEAHDPYQASDDRPSPGGPKMKQIKSMIRFHTTDLIKDALMDYGALSVSMWWPDDPVYYNSGDYTYYCPDSVGESGYLWSNHAVTLVGWDDTKAVTGGPQPNPPGPGAWIVKNSWSTGFGESGYFYISYYDTNAVVPVGGGYGFFPLEPESSYGRIYQYDELGAVGMWGFESATPDTCWGANVFTAAASENLVAVAFYAAGPNTTYTVYVYDTFNGSEFSDLLTSKSGSLSNEGYHTVTLDTPVELTSGDQFAIMVRLTTSDADWPMAVEYALDGYSSGAVVNSGESYMSPDGSSWEDGYSGEEGWNTNVCLKGLTAGVPAGTGSINVLDSILPADDHQMPFGTKVQGVSVTKQVEIQNTDISSSLTVSSIGVSAKALSGAFDLANVPSLPAVIAPGGSVAFDVKFVPSEPGTFEDTLIIASNDEDTPLVSIALSGEATPGGMPAAGTAALVLLAGAIATATAIKNRRRR